MDLSRNAFGNTGLEVTPIGLGAFPVGQDQISEKDAEKLLNGVLDCGVNLIDTARGYGLSEERIGKYLAHRRDEYVLSTKVGYDVEGYEDWSAGAVEAGIDRALRLMRTDVLDIVHLHSCSIELLQSGELAEVMNRARKAGKIKVAAYSGENESLDFAIASGGFQSVQFSINLCDQRSIERALINAKEHNLGVIAKRPIANVFWRFSERPIGAYAEEYWLRARVMGLVPPENMDWLNIALRFAAFTPGVHTCIVGTGKLDHFLENVKVLKRGPLPDELVQEYRKLFNLHDDGWVGQV